jgi:hypothetical protein
MSIELSAILAYLKQSSYYLFWWNLEKTGKIIKIAFICEIAPRGTIDRRPNDIPRGNRFCRSAHTRLPNFTVLRSNLTSCQYDRYPVWDLNCLRPEFKLGAVLLTWKETWRLSGSCVWGPVFESRLGKRPRWQVVLVVLGIRRWVLFYSLHLSYVCFITRFYNTVIKVVQVEDIKPLHLKRRR